jgi:hypothetical protein
MAMVEKVNFYSYSRLTRNEPLGICSIILECSDILGSSLIQNDRIEDFNQYMLDYRLNT